MTSVFMPADTSYAREFFDSIHGQLDPFAYLSSLPYLPQPFFEADWIDFKGQPQNDKDGQHIWSKALSGYANTSDGLIVWGIDTKPTPPKNIDAASGLRLIQDPAVFESKLRAWVRDATNPPVIGIEYHPYPGPNNEGFVVTFVPHSGHKPHRAEWSQKQYYYRVGDDFRIAEPSLLRLLFYPRYSPQFDIQATLTYKIERRTHDTVCSLLAHLDIRNSGNASAYETSIMVAHNGKAALTQLQHPWLINSSHWQVIETGLDKLGVMANIPLHPGHSLPFMHSSPCNVFLRNLIPNLATSPLLPTFAELHLTLDVYARDTAPSRYSTSFNEKDLEAADTSTKQCDVISC
jgi:Putative DNA-binding domain